MKKSIFFKKPNYLLVAALALAAWFVWYAVWNEAPGGKLEVAFLDVGQGDAIFVQSPSGNQILIDGGPDATVLARLGRLMPFYDRSIDLVILTHPQLDHVAGLVEVLKRYRVERVVETGARYRLSAYEEWQKVIQEKNIPVTVARKGQKIHLESGIVLDILSPQERLAGKNPAGEINNTSVVSRLVFGETSFLFTGDIEAVVERELAAASDLSLDSEVLKVAHHGSKTSSAEEFLKAVRPNITVIQVGGKNRYGHPTQEVLNRLEQFGARILRNDINGTVKILSNGKELKVKTER